MVLEAMALEWRWRRRPPNGTGGRPSPLPLLSARRGFEELMQHSVTLILGDGTGPELAAVTRKVLDATGVEFDWTEVEAGVDVMERAGTPLPDEVLESIKASPDNSPRSTCSNSSLAGS